MAPCREEQVVNRLECVDQTTSTVMPWAAAPIISDDYTLRSADGPDRRVDPTTYTPGEFLTITVRVVKYRANYRGLLLHANAASGEKVGEWALPTAADYDYWHPPVCGPKTVLHSGASVKSLTNHFRFRAPPAGTGSITFKALVKTGPANDGAFYRLRDLTLKEAAAAAAATEEASNGWWVGKSV